MSIIKNIVKSKVRETKQLFEIMRSAYRVQNPYRQQQHHSRIIETGAETFRIEFIQDQDLVRANLCLVSMVLRCEDGVDRIFVDDEFFKLSPESQEAMLLHEQGHLVFGHIDKIASSRRNNALDRIRASKTGVQDIELEADFYAASKIGFPQMARALSEMLQVVSINSREVTRRIEILIGMEMQHA